MEIVTSAKSSGHTLIAQIEPPQNDTTGDYYYRTYAPGRTMAEQEGVYFVGLTSLHRKRDRIMLNADVVILKNICDPDFLPLIAERKHLGRPTIFELADDLWNLQPWNAVYQFYQVEENRQLLKTTARFCDGLQFTTEELEKCYGYLNPVCEVFPNQILTVPPEKPCNWWCDDSCINIGWGGSHGHFEDIQAIAPAMVGWLKENSTAVLHLMCSDTIWNLFDSLPSEKKVRYKPGTINDYYSFLTHLDVGIAPLNDTPFNRSRSDVKFLEYAVNEVVPIVQDLEPYKSVTRCTNGYLFRQPLELIATLDMIVKNKKLLHRNGLIAKSYVMRKRIQSIHCAERVKFYRMVTHQAKRSSGANVTQNSGVIEELLKINDADIHGKHITLKFSKYENLLHDGLVALQAPRGRRAAHEMFIAAATTEKDEYLPHLFLHGTSKNQNVYLREALKRNPSSVRSLMLLGEKYANSGKFIESLECFKKAANMLPCYDVPLKKMAVVLRKIGSRNEADQLDRYATSMVLGL